MAELHYCDIFGDCYHCPAAYCPYEKLGPGWLDNVEEDDDGSEDENLQD